jgi:hypothetical protein
LSGTFFSSKTLLPGAILEGFFPCFASRMPRVSRDLRETIAVPRFARVSDAAFFFMSNHKSSDFPFDIVF